MEHLTDSDNDSSNQIVSDIDVSKLLGIVFKSLIWIALIFTASVFIGYIHLRYTKDVYVSSSLFKIDQKDQSTTLGLKNFSDENSGELQGEIELIKSNIIYDKVIAKLNLYVTYYKKGEFKDMELYHTVPFNVIKYEILSPEIYNQEIVIKYLDSNKYELIVGSLDHSESFIHTFGRYEKNRFVEIKIDNKMEANEIPAGDFYFMIHNEGFLKSYLRQNLSVITNEASHTIKIEFRDFNRFKIKDIVNAIDTAYLNHTLETKKLINEQTIEFLEGQIASTGKLLQSSMNDYQDFSTKNLTVNIERDFGLKITEINSNDKEILLGKYDVMVLDKVTELLKEDKLEDALRHLTVFGYTEFDATYEKYKKVLESQHMLNYTTKKNTMAYLIKSEDFDKVKEEVVLDLDNMIESRKLKLNTLLASKNKAVGDLRTLPEKLIESDRIKRNYDLHEKFYLMLNTRKIEYEIAKAGIVPEFKILASASLPSTPVLPVRPIVFLYCAVTGLSLSLMLIVVRYFLHNTITSQKDVEKLTRVPVSGFVPKYSRMKMEVSQLVVNKNPKSMISEAFRTIRTNLEFISTLKNKIISVTSTISGEGKTFVSINISGSIAQSGLKTVLLDVDMRKPKINLAFGHENTKGMSTILSGKTSIEECILETPIENLDFIAAGPTPPNPSELILRDELGSLILKLKEKYDVIIMDTPPTGLVTDGVLIMKKVDLPLYVIRSEYTKIGFEKNINKLFKNKEFSNLSIIINSVAGSLWLWLWLWLWLRLL